MQKKERITDAMLEELSNNYAPPEDGDIPEENGKEAKDGK